jgi:hypothetical protein
MNLNGLARHYDVLTADERFRLVVEASARQDDTEVDRLKRTCPTKTYSMPDAAFFDRWQAGEFITLVVALDLTQHLAKMEVAAASAWAAPHLRQLGADAAADAYMAGVRLGTKLAWQAAGRDGEPAQTGDAEPAIDAGILAVMAEVGEKPDILATVSEGILSHMAAEVRAVWDGFDRFCRAELLLAPETVMAGYFAPMLGRLERQRERLDRTAPEPAKVAEYVDGLTTGWRRWLGLEGRE